jgi:hypothetical protein
VGSARKLVEVFRFHLDLDLMAVGINILEFGVRGPCLGDGGKSTDPIGEAPSRAA